MIITTPSGYKVEFKDRLNYGDRRAIKAILLQSMTVELDPKNQDKSKISPMNLEFTQKMEEEVFKRAIKSVEIDGKKQTGDLLDLVYTWDDSDGEAVFEYLNKNFNPQGVTEQEKKTEN
jgi:hypothetical protein